MTQARFHGGHLRRQQSVSSLQVVQLLFQGSNVPTPTIDARVDDSKMAINVQVPTFHSKQVVVQEKMSPLVILIQVLDPLPLLEHAGFDPIPLSRVVNSEVNHENVQQLTLVVSLSRRAHTQSVTAAEYLITLVDASKAQSLGLGSTTP